MIRHLLLACTTALVLALPVSAAPKDDKKPTVEVVFVIDTTGSMRDLIAGAKEKIWAICNQIASGKPTPNLKIGLVAYRDKNDAYITQVHDLNDDLDAVNAKLKEFNAAGGGDIPEHVNQALDDAVNKIKWSTENKTLRIIFLVGDAPPQTKYDDDVKYETTCKKACEKGILVNTIQCGDNKDCAVAWKDIAVKAEGTYVRIEQDGGVVKTVETPFDKELTEANKELAKTTLVFGSKELQKEGEQKKKDAQALPPGAASERAAFQAKSGKNAAYDLLDQINEGKIKLEDLKEAELPEEMKKMKPEERKDHLKKMEQERETLRKKILELDKKRSDFIAKQKDQNKSGFDNQVLEILRKQAKKHNIDY